MVKGKAQTEPGRTPSSEPEPMDEAVPGLHVILAVTTLAPADTGHRLTGHVLDQTGQTRA
jgi:hypothetical protein